MKHPWNPANATLQINKLAKAFSTDLFYTYHAEQQMQARGLTTLDVMHVLKQGFVYENAVSASRGRFKYQIEGRTPNSGSRVVKIVLIPSIKHKGLKLITVMWKDEK